MAEMQTLSKVIANSLPTHLPGNEKTRQTQLEPLKSHSGKSIDQIGVWLSGFVEMLSAFRGVTIPSQHKQIYLLELVRCNFSREQQQSAEKWMKLGDWTYKGKGAGFVYQDFFPTKAQLESIQEGFLLLSKEELAVKLRRERETAEVQTRAAVTPKQLTGRTEQSELEQLRKDYNLKLIELENVKIERSKLRAQCEKLKKASSDSETDKRIFDVFGRFEGLKDIVDRVINDDEGLTYTKALRQKAREQVAKGGML